MANGPDDLTEVTISSETVFHGRLVHLRVDTVRLPNGRTSTREVVQHPGGVAVVPILDPETVMLVRQYRQAAGRDLLEIPAGTIEPGEDPVECAARELEEEVGYRAARLEKIFHSYLAPGYSSEILHTFVATDLTKSSDRTDADEFVRAEPIRLADARSMIQSGEICDAKTICGLLLAERWLSGER